MSNKGFTLFENSRDRSRVLIKERLFEGYIGLMRGSMVYCLRTLEIGVESRLRRGCSKAT